MTNPHRDPRPQHAPPQRDDPLATRGARRLPLRRCWPALLSSLLFGGLGACAPTADDSKLPPEVQDPKTLRTPQGARELYRAALLVLPGALDRVMLTSAILTDELAALPTPSGVVGAYTELDSRKNTTGAGDEAYNRLHRLRAQLREARAFLGAYVTEPADTALAHAQQGHLYAAEGYADVLLADLFCSGIPLSTVDFEGDYTLAEGSSTREVYRTAAALFDSALALASGDSPFVTDSVRPLALLGKARALLALGVYDSAALAAAAVPTDLTYRVTVPGWSLFSFADNQSGSGGRPPQGYQYVPGLPGVGHNEGQNGLDYLASDDPRVGGTLLGEGFYFHAPYYFPAKYDPFSQTIELVLASGIEARLIEAEAALQAGSGEWLTLLNTLRQTVGLADTTDPGTPDARVDLLFRERAFWLYLTAHRQGDLRRLIRLPYGRDPDAVYPSGGPSRSYPGGDGQYGTEVVVPVPASEQQLNHQYTGCIHRGA